MPAGLGAADAQGVWQFGESDTQALASDLLNLAQSRTSTQFAADRTRLASLENKVSVFSSAAARNSFYGTPGTAAARRALQDIGATVVRLDTGVIERYFANATDGGSNPGGRKAAGWYSDYATYLLRDERASGTDSGIFTSGAWQTRTLQTAQIDEIVGASLASNVVTLPAGTYLVEGRASAYAVDAHQTKIRQTSGTPADLLWGSSELASSTAAGSATASTLRGRIVLSASTTIELQHRCQTTRATNGYGAKGSYGGVEVFAELLLKKVA